MSTPLHTLAHKHKGNYLRRSVRADAEEKAWRSRVTRIALLLPN